MTHYICIGGCRGVSEEPGICQAENCPKHKHPLEECNCSDDKHHGVFKLTEEKKEEGEIS